jgi:hypothetical protein
LVNIIEFMYPQYSKEFYFKTALRIKKWIIHTDYIHPWTVFVKDKIYLEWYKNIKHRAINWKLDDKIYKGKIKIHDLDFII